MLATAARLRRRRIQASCQSERPATGGGSSSGSGWTTMAPPQS